MIVEDTETVLELGRMELERRRKIADAKRGTKAPREVSEARAERANAKWDAIWQARFNAVTDPAERHRLEIERNHQLRRREKRRLARQARWEAQERGSS
jgi:hypothetical protein